MRYSNFADAAREAANYINVEEVRTTKINEIAFAKAFIAKHRLVYCNAQFYSDNGITSEAAVKNLVYKEIKQNIKHSVPSLISRLLECIKLEASTTELPVSENLIRFKNGTFILSKNNFTKKKAKVVNVIPHNYNPSAPVPERFLSFLSQLLREEDIPVIQEYIGYLFVPSTKAQKALFIIGEGQEGKSVLGAIIRHIFGPNAEVGKVHSIENDKFYLANLEGKLAFIDDDFDPSAITSTGILKELITCTSDMSIQKKFEQARQARMFARIICIGNAPLQALHDRSRGFQRRKLVIRVKPRDPDRVDNPSLIDEIISETPSIIKWALDGLNRLIENNYHFSVSNNILEEALRDEYESNTPLAYMRSEGYFLLDGDAYSTSESIYESYKDFCQRNCLAAVTTASFTRFLSEHSNEYNLEPVKRVPNMVKDRRGFKGIRLLNEFDLLNEKIKSSQLSNNADGLNLEIKNIDLSETSPEEVESDDEFMSLFQ